jgi:glycosyltransferase involved in cell wall biosynthesis
MESLHRLFGDRLGLEVHVPYGLDWKAEGYWNFGWQYTDGGEGVARQFLLMPEIDELQPLRRRRLTTLAEAREMDDWALVICSVPDNEFGYSRFASEKGARYAVQVGNANQPVNRSLDPFILDATGQYPGGVAFTPEFDISGTFAHIPPFLRTRTASSFVNLFPALPCFPAMEQVDEALTACDADEWMFYVYGHNGPSGFVKPTAKIAQWMYRSAFGWHDKVTGDGFGYVIHYWASVGRPIIGHASHYAGQVAADLWEDGVTCIDLDRHSTEEVARLMNEIMDDSNRHAEMSATIAQRVRERIDFAADAERVADALGLLVPA